MGFIQRLGKELLIFDGAMGTLLQKSGLAAGELPEIRNFESEELIYDIHRRYIDAGADVITTNTFGANSLKLASSGYSVEQVVKKACAIARRAADEAEREVFVALDLGPTGKLLEPYGDLPFEKAYELYKEQIVAARDTGVDFVLLETMGDLYEIKAAVLAAKENCELPVAVSMIFNDKGQLLTGADIKTAVFAVESFGADAIGLNCGAGPKQMIEFAREALKYTSLPLIVNPNAGLPECVNGVTSYNVLPDEFSDDMASIVSLGASAVGGCCGTTDGHIRRTAEKCRKIPILSVKPKHFTAVTSYSKTVIIGGKPVIIGERINPTGKKKLKEALRSGDFDYIISEAVAQADRGSDILDVNVGLPEIDEREMLVKAVSRVQGVVNLPLQIDTADTDALEAALRIYNGKPLINSVNAKRESMSAVFPLAAKYGAAVVCLTLDEDGIPDSAEGRIELARRIIETAEKYGVSKDNLIFDALTLTVSTGADNAKITLDTLSYLRNTLGVNTVLGVSNISFGLPSRESMNTAFFTMALHSGLSAGIINPLSEEMMNAYYSYCALAGFDDNCENYIGRIVSTQPTVSDDGIGLKEAIIKGMVSRCSALAGELLTDVDALEIISDYIVPALDEVGQGFENGTVFLPQLLRSADCAKAAFDEIKSHLASSGEKQNPKGRIVLCTVKGDIHDIGKNIVRVLLENYGFEVIDLGKDVAPETVLEAAREYDVRLVGLSALMTTTVVSMQQTIELLKREIPDITVCVGGAVLNQEYADSIGADFYSKDAMGTVRFAEKFFE